MLTFFSCHSEMVKIRELTLITSSYDLQSSSHQLSHLHLFFGLACSPGSPVAFSCFCSRLPWSATHSQSVFIFLALDTFEENHSGIFSEYLSICVRLMPIEFRLRPFSKNTTEASYRVPYLSTSYQDLHDVNLSYNLRC